MEAVQPSMHSASGVCVVARWRSNKTWHKRRVHAKRKGNILLALLVQGRRLLLAWLIRHQATLQHFNSSEHANKPNLRDYNLPWSVSFTPCHSGRIYLRLCIVSVCIRVAPTISLFFWCECTVRGFCRGLAEALSFRMTLCSSVFNSLSLTNYFLSMEWPQHPGHLCKMIF